MVSWVSVVALQMAESSKRVQLIRCQGLWLDLAGVARSMACMEVGKGMAESVSNTLAVASRSSSRKAE